MTATWPEGLTHQPATAYAYSSSSHPRFLSLATAQTDPALEAGLKPFGVYQGGDIDVINTSTGKLHVHIPLFSYPQLGGRLHVDYFIDYDSAAYQEVIVQGHDIYNQITGVFLQKGAWVQTDAAPGLTSSEVFTGSQNNVYVGTIVNVIDPDGDTHRLGAIPGSGVTTQMRALDASGYYYTNNAAWTNAVVYDANGHYYNTSTHIMADAIGNSMTVIGGAVTDTIHRSIPAPPPPPSSSCLNWNVPGQDNGTVPYQLCYQSPISNTLLSKVVLPNGTSYTFNYEQVSIDNEGTIFELTEIGLPTGGTILYTWGTQPSKCGTENSWRMVTSRTVYDGTHYSTWNYSRTTSGYTATFTITDPLNNVAVHTSTDLNQNGYCSYYETQYQQKDNASNVLSTVATAYQFVPDPGSEGQTPYYAFAVAPTTITTTLGTGSTGVTSQTTKQYANSFGFCDLAEEPGENGQGLGCTQSQASALYVANPGTVVDNDYTAPGGNGGTLRTTAYTYQAFVNNNYLLNNQVNLKEQVQVSSPLGNGNTTVYSYDVGGGTAGNLTQINKGLNAIYNMTYTPKGMLYQSIDPLSNSTTYTYDSSNLFPSSIENALGQYTYYNYDDNTGLLNAVRDPNNQTTSYTYDEMNRLLSVAYPDGGSTGYTYDDTPGSLSVQVTDAITSSQNKVETATVDGLGRLTRTELNTDPEAPDYVDTVYDGLGRKASVSNPYRTTNDPTYGVTSYQYDALNRLLTQTQPDQSAIQYSYSGNQTIVTDETGNLRKTQTNALGWLTNVWEAPGVNGYGYETSYTYDGLGNLTLVSQPGANNRTFVFDQLSRLTSANNPETGPASYGYDTTSTLTSKTDNRHFTITYRPDALHRIISKSYSDSEPIIYYCYDNQQAACGTLSVPNGVGRRTGMADASGTTSWSYDVMGRVAKTLQTIAGQSGETWYYYNLDGSLNYEVYPDGNNMWYTYSSAARPIVANYDDLGENFNYVNNATYTASGALTSYQNENFAQNVVGTISNSYNNRLQPAALSAATSQGTIFSLTYNFNLANHDNGNVVGVTNNLDSTRSQTFTYDPLNRLQTAGTSSSWGNTYTYDSRGNLTGKNSLSGRSQGESWTDTSDANNHMNGYGYDLAGNLSSINGVIYNIFNAENQWVSQTTYNVSYLYDGDGHRVVASGGASGTRVYWHDVTGNVIEENDQNDSVVNEYLYLGGQRIARVYEQFSPYYYYGDHLGTSRVIADQNGNKCYDADYFPWGDEEHVFVNSCAQNYKFTGKERDPDMGVDYFGARFYQGGMARFYSPDWSASPLDIPYADLTNPQSLNLYSYVNNNPLSKVDKDGHEVDLTGTDKDKKEELARLAANASKTDKNGVKESSLFKETTDKNGKTTLTLDKDAAANFKGEHSAGYNLLTGAIDAKPTISVGLSDKDSFTSRPDAQGNVTVNLNRNVSPIDMISPLRGFDGQVIPNPFSIIAGHETLGHAYPRIMGWPSDEQSARQVENQLRREQGLPLRNPNSN